MSALSMIRSCSPECNGGNEYAQEKENVYIYIDIYKQARFGVRPLCGAHFRAASSLQREKLDAPPAHRQGKQPPLCAMQLLWKSNTR